MIQKKMTVSQLVRGIKTLLSGNALFRRMTVEGELSNVKLYPSGHCYFDLKDESAKISCVLFARHVEKLTFAPVDGMQVILEGGLSMYERGGQVQIIVERMQMAGIGDYYRAYEVMKAKLGQLGWFDSQQKKPLPEEIRRVGVVTSSAGAAIHDIISVCGRRDPRTELLLIPAQVQGVGAAESIARGIRRFDAMGQVDVIIVGRGGGSIEDLWAFNEAVVATAVHECRIPVVSAVGHETDFTICDFVSDLRAPTPSAAAELVTVDIHQIAKHLADTQIYLDNCIGDMLRMRKIELAGTERRLAHCSPTTDLKAKKQVLGFYGEKLQSSMQHILTAYRTALKGCAQTLTLTTPRNVLERGYVYVTDQREKMIKSVSQLQPGEAYHIHFADGVGAVIGFEEVEHGRN